MNNRKIVSRLVVCLLIFVTLFSITASAQKQEKEDWIKLFNGKNLKGWDIKIAGHKINDNYNKTFKVEDGMLRISYDNYKTFDDKYGHLYYKQPYSYYVLKFQYRFVGNQTPGGAAWNVRNSGVMIHSQSAKSNSIGQHFPVSLEVQLLGGLGRGTRHTGNLCTPGTQVYMGDKLNPAHCIDSDSKTYDGDQWVNVTVIVMGDSIVRHVVEADTVLTYYKTQVGGGFVSRDYEWKRAGIENGDYWASMDGTALKSGYIALQAESHPIDFRNIQLLNLEGCTDPKAKNYKSYYIKSDNKQCRY